MGAPGLQPGGGARGLGAALAAVVLTAACVETMPQPDQRQQDNDQTRQAERQRMVQEQIRARGIRDTAVLDAMARVPRHRFVPAGAEPLAYADQPLPIGHDQTISQPYIVAYMTETAGLEPTDRVLEIGTGSGYQAAVLGEIVREVYTIEIVPELAERARATLAALGYEHVHVRSGDGYQGWPEHAPFDAIVVTAAPDHVPQPLVEQLGTGARMVIPVGRLFQEIVIITRTEGGAVEERTIPVRFVPLVRKP